MIDTKGRSLELFYIDGHPDGMITAELFNWTGHVFVTPRTRLTEALKREETGYAGVYLLLGEKDGESFAYIGEAEDLGVRLKQHAAASDKDWWETAVLVSASANRLNKAHVKYLEARLIVMAREIGHTPLHNGNSPKPPGLTEADIAKMEAFLASLMVVLPAIRVDMFIQRSRPAGSSRPVPAFEASEGEKTDAASETVRFVLHKPRVDLTAKAVFQDGEFIVEAGSQARSDWHGDGTYKPLHEELVRSGILQMDGEHRVFTKDYAFKSPSAAAAVVFGHPVSGPAAWKLESNPDISFRDWQAHQLDAVTEKGTGE
ncbi:GIY-YIG nuclease family protein [Acetobacter orientalis]|uniref:GIY-YIG nuclease family protein n=1 Tax=Acetobacter orientalis TaxID=146474 RepID=UPI0020A02B3D|nr:GIY-YIG nuclease family protein [Acetobacter orientalis]MCP1217171.1 GIY-YIG nuclease family protein [Acetobacter orientalis]MCP1220080.1 GIY-YIG nuclease family protein [Acetobacter orientalis]